MITTTIFVFLNILFIELILSIDNASVIALIVRKKLSDPVERDKALKYGIIGAYVFRGLSLFLVSWILYNPSIGAFFKIAGGIYLCVLFYKHLTPEVDSPEEGDVGVVDRFAKWIGLGTFWSTVLAVEFLDIVFSVDNLLACVSLSSNIYIVCAAVFLGILGMRFVASYFTKILERYPALEKSAFLVILFLGIKLCLAGVFDFFPETAVHHYLNHHNTDLVFSLVTLSVFAYPIIKEKVFTRRA